MSRLSQYLTALNSQIAGKIDGETLLKEIACRAVKLCMAELSLISLYDEMTDELYYHLHCQSNIRPSVHATYKETFQRIHSGQGIIGWCAAHKTAVNIPDVRDDTRFNAKVDEKFGLSLRSVLSMPLLFNEELYGVLTVMNRRGKQKRFNARDEERLSAFGLYATLFIANHKMRQEHMNQERLSDIGQSIISSAHGLKNLLNNMDGGTYIVEMGASKKNIETVYEGWDIIKRNSQRLRELVVDMLLYSRPRKPEYSPTDIEKLCTELIDLVQEKARSFNVEVRLESEAEIGSVYIDPRAIHRGILNLVSNAIYACQMKNGGEVTIRLREKDDDSLEVVIEDNGIGISEGNLSHIFEVFFTTKGSKGTGLGLPVTQKIISEHHGTLTVDSEPEVGTTFTITLPKTHPPYEV